MVFDNKLSTSMPLPEASLEPVIFDHIWSHDLALLITWYISLCPQLATAHKI